MADHAGAEEVPLNWLGQKFIARNRQGRHDANVSLVAEAMKRWRLQHGAYDVDGPAVAEFVVQVLEQEGRLL